MNKISKYFRLRKLERMKQSCLRHIRKEKANLQFLNEEIKLLEKE